MIVAAASAKISPLADIEDSTRGSTITIGENVVIDSFVKIKPTGGAGDVEIGDGTYINSGTVIYSGNGVRIGRGVLIAANCTLAPVNHEFRSRHKTIREQRFAPSKGGITIGDDVWIGAGCVLLDGCVIQRGVVIGSNSLVKGTLEEYGIYAGNPIRQLGQRT
jgi:virginiamycin A acetyltransferase